MKPNHPVLTPPWIPVGLSTLVLLGLVVVLNQRVPTAQLTSPLANTQPSEVTVTSIHFITKIQWQQRLRSVTSTSSPNGENGNWSSTSAQPETAAVASGVVGQDLWNQDLVPVFAGASYTLSMTPAGRLRLECERSSTEVNVQFSVPLDAISCVLQITGAPGTPWLVSRTP